MRYFTSQKIMKIQFKAKKINSKPKRTEKFLNVVIKEKRRVIPIGMFNRQIGILAISINDIIMALKRGVFFSHKFKNKFEKVAVKIGQKELKTFKY